MTSSPAIYADIEKCVDAIIEKVGKDIKFGMPLGLGKPVHLVNALYARAKKDPELKLTIASAISLEKPGGSSRLEKNFMGPFSKRVFADIPDIEYVKDLRANKLPSNVVVQEFFFKAGSFLNHPGQQQNYICTNYTHVVRDLVRLGVNVAAQIVAKRTIDGKTTYSLSCNPDTSLDLVPRLRELEAKGKKIAIVGEVNNNLPFMVNHAEVEGDAFDMLVDSKAYEYPLFGAPNMAITPADHMIGFNASTLLKDGGTLQVGIGSLGSALVYSTILRHEHNDVYQTMMDELQLSQKFPIISEIGERGRFDKGLYGCSEMMVDGFIYLYRAGILKREVFDDFDLQTLINEGKVHQKVDMSALDALLERGVISSPLKSRDVDYLKKYGVLREGVEYRGGSLVIDDKVIGADLENQEHRDQLVVNALGDSLKGGIIMHGGFFLGPQNFYQMLRDLSEDENKKFCMTSVCFINHLFDHFYGDQKLKVAQRKEARFINSTMMYTMNGAAVSDGLESGKVVSGVGGQYNFVAMAHEIDDARSILKMKSTRSTPEGVKSNIVLNYGHITIPRHLRDVVVTEYGVADLLGKADKDVYIELIKIADSRFQDELISQAKAVGKIPADYQLPAEYRNNTPERLMSVYNKYKAKGFFDPFPFGCDFTAEELKIGKALKGLKAKTGTRGGMFKAILDAIKIKDVPQDLRPLLQRMSMDNPAGLKEKLEQKLLLSELMG
ncbi:MAG: acetyl-CoA hydrolase [Hahellaceae bacterium]|nr:acetyl-CoA hydrolase [Hahellaceae bacterium]